MTGRIFVKLVLAVLCVLAFSLMAVHFLATRTAEHAYTAHLRGEIQDKARLLVSMPPEIVRAQVDELAKAGNGRITLVDRTGQLIADSSPKPSVITDYTVRS